MLHISITCSLDKLNINIEKLNCSKYLTNRVFNTVRKVSIAIIFIWVNRMKVILLFALSLWPVSFCE